MSWIKRNLPFVIGGAVAVVLLGLAGYYCYTQWALNNESLEKLDQAYADWQRITELNPNPGNDKVDNIKLSREQQKVVRAVIDKVDDYFVPIPPIPNPANGVVVKGEFASGLRITVDQLRKNAAAGGVTIPENYEFSFQAERFLPNFAPGSLNPLAHQLGDIKLICNILFQAKINSLDAVRRERISTDDQNGPQSDYLDPGMTSVTNDLAVLVPYEVTFRCFSAELGAVLSGFGGDNHGIIVKSVNVDTGTSAMGGVGQVGQYGGYNNYMGPGYNPAQPRFTDAPTPPVAAGYPNYYNPEAMRGMPGGVAPAPVARNGLQTVLDEKPLRVTLVLNVVRLLPKK